MLLTTASYLHLPLYEARVVYAPATHNLEDPPRVVGLERVLHRRPLQHGHRERRVPPAVRHGHDAVLRGLAGFWDHKITTTVVAKAISTGFLEKACPRLREIVLTARRCRDWRSRNLGLALLGIFIVFCRVNQNLNNFKSCHNCDLIICRPDQFDRILAWSEGIGATMRQWNQDGSPHVLHAWMYPCRFEKYFCNNDEKG